MARIDLPRDGLGLGGSSFLALRDQGVPSATPAYYQETGEAAQNINAANDWIAQMIAPDVDFKLTSLSIRTQNETTEGIRTIELFSHNPATGKPGSSLQALGSLGSGGGGATPEWNRLAISSGNQYQLYHGKAYWIVSKGADGADWDESIRRWNTAQGSMFPDSMPKAMYSTDGGSTWTECTQDSKPALWNIVINSLESHVPQLCYGRRDGKFIVMPSGPEEIQEAGHFLDCSGLTADTLYNVFMDSSGVLKASTDDWVKVNGLMVRDGTPSEKFVGIIYPKDVLGSGDQAPVDCMDRRLLAYKGMRKYWGKYCPYYSATTDSNAGTISWRQIMDNNDWKIEGIGDTVWLEFHTSSNSNGNASCSIGLNKTIPDSYSESGSMYYGGNTGYARYYRSGLPVGLHYAFPLIWTSSAGQGLRLWNDTAIMRSQFMGRLEWRDG
jgi:hypothetical protein